VERKITSGLREGEEVTVPQAANLCAWLTAEAKVRGLRWLLAHADNGIIWGELRDDTLHLSSEAFGPAELRLDAATLQQARLFGKLGELRVWQGPNGLLAYALRDGAGEPADFIDEAYLLWGWAANPPVTSKGFIELVEGRQGITHAPPLSAAPSEQQRASLLVRHYLVEAQDSGAVRVVDSRLVGLLTSEVEP